MDFHQKNSGASRSLRFAGGVLAVLVLGLSGCVVGPPYQRPAALGTNALPKKFEGVTTNAQWKAAEPQAHFARGAWWEIFSDPELNRLESMAAFGNQDLAAALARYEQAHALLGVARANLYPTLDATPAYQRLRTSANQAQLGRPAGAGYNYNNLTAPFQAGWEVDLWGRVRHEVESANARLAAAGDDLESLKLSIQAELVTDYFSMLAAGAEFELLRQTVTAYQRSLDLTRNRRAGGIATDLDVAQAESQLKSTEAQLPLVELQRTKLRDSVATLCGQAATDFKIAAIQLPGQLPAIPPSLPSELLERRPDIAATERRMAAANADVGVAQTAFYPRIQLQGLAGFQSINAGTLFSWPSRFWAVGPSLDLPIFTGGRNRAQLALARGAYHETVALFKKAVLTAFQDVEDQLAAQRLLAAQLEGETAALVAARRTLEIANNRYQAGLVTYLEVATAQSDALTHERTVVRLKADQFNASVALIKALGGLWEH
jgi:multidrug efflux system outer membrane protein